MALVGIAYNGFEGAVTGLLLTLQAALIYGIARNRIVNLDEFEGVVSVVGMPPPPGVNLVYFELICKWLGSRYIFEGLLSDLADPHNRMTKAETRWYLFSALWASIYTRTRDKVVALLVR